MNEEKATRVTSPGGRLGRPLKVKQAKAGVMPDQA